MYARCRTAVHPTHVETLDADNDEQMQAERTAGQQVAVKAQSLIDVKERAIAPKGSSGFPCNRTLKDAWNLENSVSPDDSPSSARAKYRNFPE